MSPGKTSQSSKITYLSTSGCSNKYCCISSALAFIPKTGVASSIGGKSASWNTYLILLPNVRQLVDSTILQPVRNTSSLRHCILSKSIIISVWFERHTASGFFHIAVLLRTPSMSKNRTFIVVYKYNYVFNFCLLLRSILQKPEPPCS